MKLWLLLGASLCITAGLRAQEQFADVQSQTNTESDSLADTGWGWLIFIVVLIFVLALLDRGINHHR